MSTRSTKSLQAIFEIESQGQDSVQVLATTEVRSRSTSMDWAIYAPQQRFERISNALANETRLLIFEAMARNKDMTSSTIVILRRVAAATVSHHLKILSGVTKVENPGLTARRDETLAGWMSR